jgi:hypothetical protein
MYRRIVSLVLVFCMSLHCAAKLGIVAYFYTNQTYIQNQLCINKEKPLMHCEGKCFLAAKLKSAENPVRHSPSFLKTAIESFYLMSQNQDNKAPVLANLAKKDFFIYLIKIYQSPQTEIEQPPKLI